MPSTYYVPPLITSLSPAPSADALLVCDTDGVPRWIPRSVLTSGDIRNMYQPYIMFNLDMQTGAFVSPAGSVISKYVDLSQYDNTITTLISENPSTDNNRRYVIIPVNAFSFFSIDSTCFTTASSCFTIFIVWKRSGNEATNTNHFLFESQTTPIFSLRGNENDGFYTCLWDGNTITSSANTYTKKTTWTVTSVTVNIPDESITIRENCAQVATATNTLTENQFDWQVSGMSFFASASGSSVICDCGQFLVADTYANMTQVQNIEKYLLFSWGAFNLVA